MAEVETSADKMMTYAMHDMQIIMVFRQLANTLKLKKFLYMYHSF